MTGMNPDVHEQTAATALSADVAALVRLVLVGVREPP
jgi:hypothetical protein